MMGCSNVESECFADESPAHQVTLTQAFYMGRYEVTQAQWLAKMGTTPGYFVGNPNNPVERVSWNMIQGFNAVTGLRMPTEAEWEWACRAGTTTARYGAVNAIAWYEQNIPNYSTQPVAGKLPNALGLYDTLGNVWEWCQDWYGPYSLGSMTNPTGLTTGTSRLLRGGSFGDNPIYCRSSQRLSNNVEYQNINTGFRVARNP